MLLRDVMTTEVELVPPDATLKDAADKMRELDIGTLVVGERDQLVGMLTDRDITVRATAKGRNPTSTKVRDVMTPSTVCCFADQDVEEAAQIMAEKQIRRLVVLDREHRLAGIVSLGDLAVQSGNNELAGDTIEEISRPGKH